MQPTVNGQKNFANMRRLVHELRNLVAPISHAVQIIRLQVDDHAHILPATAMIEREVTRIGRILDKLALAEQIFAEDALAECEAVELAGTLQTLSEASASLLTPRGMVLCMEMPAREVSVKAARSHLTAALLELVENAANASRDGASIFVDVMCCDGIAAIRVRDEGKGLSSAQIHGLFDAPEASSGHAPSPSMSGLGMGLASVRRIAELMGGRVTAESPGPGKGAAFAIQLPICHASGEASTDAGTVQREERPWPGNKARAQRVLVVDDSMALQASLMALIADLGHEARAVATGKAALPMVREWQPDLVMLDVHLPDSNGFEVARRLRGSAEFSHVHLCLMSVDDFNGVIRKEAQAAGIDSCVSKLDCGRHLHQLLMPSDASSSD